MKAAAFVLLCLFSATCLAGSVRVELEEGADLAPYRTFGWTDGDEDLRDTDEELHEILIDMMTEQFTASGLVLAESDPDLQFAYIAGEKEELRRYRSHIGSMALGSHRTTQNDTYVAVGTLSLEIVDTSTGDLVWRATAKTDLTRSSEKTNLKRISKLVRSMGKRWAKAYTRALEAAAGE